MIGPGLTAHPRNSRVDLAGRGPLPPKPLPVEDSGREGLRGIEITGPWAGPCSCGGEFVSEDLRQGGRLREER